MKWIKTSERQPPDSHERYYVKVCADGMIDHVAPMVMERFLGKWVYESEDSDDLHVIEWLDESSSLGVGKSAEACPESFKYEGKTYECVGNDDKQFWAVIDGETKGFEQSDCELLTPKELIYRKHRLPIYDEGLTLAILAAMEEYRQCP